MLHVDEVVLFPHAADSRRSPQPKSSSSPSAGTPRSRGPEGQASGSSIMPTAAAADDVLRVSSISLVADGDTASLAAAVAAAQHDMHRSSIAGHRDPAALTANPERPPSSSSMAQGTSVSASGTSDTRLTGSTALQAAVVGPPASRAGMSSHRSTLDTGASDDGLTVQVSQMSGLVMQQLAAEKTLQQQQQEQIALQQQRQQLGSGSEPGGRWRFIRPSLEHRLLQATVSNRLLAGLLHACLTVLHSLPLGLVSLQASKGDSFKAAYLMCMHVLCPIVQVTEAHNAPALPPLSTCVMSQELLARLAGKTPTIREMHTPASSDASTPGINSVEAAVEPSPAGNTAAAAVATAIPGAAEAGAASSGQAGVTGGAEGAGSAPALSQVERWKAYRVTLEEHLNAATVSVLML